MRWRAEGGERRKKGRNSAQVGLLLWNAALGFTTEDDEGTGSVIIANRGVLEGRGCGTLRNGIEIDPLEGRDWGGG